MVNSWYLTNFFIICFDSASIWNATSYGFTCSSIFFPIMLISLIKTHFITVSIQRKITTIISIADFDWLLSFSFTSISYFLLIFLFLFMQFYSCSAYRTVWNHIVHSQYLKLWVGISNCCCFLSLKNIFSLERLYVHNAPDLPVFQPSCLLSGSPHWKLPLCIMNIIYELNRKNPNNKVSLHSQYILADSNLNILLLMFFIGKMFSDDEKNTAIKYSVTFKFIRICWDWIDML